MPYHHPRVAAMQQRRAILSSFYHWHREILGGEVSGLDFSHLNLDILSCSRCCVSHPSQSKPTGQYPSDQLESSSHCREVVLGSSACGSLGSSATTVQLNPLPPLQRICALLIKEEADCCTVGLHDVFHRFSANHTYSC